MPTEADPILGNWYQHLDKGQKFCVVAFNEDEGLIEMQHFDGDLEEIDSDTWYQLDLEPIEEPENWSGPIDVGEIDDLGTEITRNDGIASRGSQLGSAGEDDEVEHDSLLGQTWDGPLWLASTGTGLCSATMRSASRFSSKLATA